MGECEACLERARVHGWPCPRLVLDTLDTCDDTTQLAAIATVASGLEAWLRNLARVRDGSQRELAESQVEYHRRALRQALAEAGLAESWEPWPGEPGREGE